MTPIRPQIHKLAAWIARQRGDLTSERRALERLIGVDPADLSALTRLAELAEKAGQPERAPSCSGRKTRSNGSRRDFKSSKTGTNRSATPRSWPGWRQSSAFGFEARAFLTIAVAANPRRNDLRDELRRLSRPPGANAPPGPTLAQVIAPELKALADPALENSQAKRETPR